MASPLRRITELVPRAEILRVLLVTLSRMLFPWPPTEKSRAVMALLPELVPQEMRLVGTAPRVPDARLITWLSAPERASPPVTVRAPGVSVSIERAPAEFQASEETVSVLAKESVPWLRLTALVAPNAFSDPTLSVPSFTAVFPV